MAEDRVDATHTIGGNDNNLPFSSSRGSNKPDDTNSCCWKSAIS
ncbi:MAG: hypothetical protein Q8M18_18310 [Bradyrhizobium sp.]|nr:hypothetical protein [Bradyrhizobium sp.]